MPTFPFIESLRIEGYGLYPGPTGNGIFNIRLAAGPWIVLGVNGLGKSTLLLLMKHLLTGTKRSIAAGFRGEDRPETTSVDTRLFAMRVANEGHGSKAVLTCRFGTSRLTVARTLSDLSLVEANVRRKGRTHKIENEEAYFKVLTELMGLFRFEDALRVLDRIIFTLEESEPLIWDVAAQYEIFRALLLPQISAELRELEAKIVSADSTARNLNAALFKVMKRRDEQVVKEKHAGEIRAHLAAANAELEIAQKHERERQRELEKADQARADSRIESKRAQRATDQAAMGYEKVKYDLLKNAFKGVPLNEQYVFLKLIAERVCLACGQSAEPAAKEIERRQGQNRCLVCGTPQTGAAKSHAANRALHVEAERAFGTLERTREAQVIADQRFQEFQQRWEKSVAALDTARTAVDRIEEKLRALHRKLPAADRNVLAREEDHVQTLRREVMRFRNDRDEAEDEITDLLLQLRSAAEAVQNQIQASFRQHARPFFGDHVRLVYASRADRIGQGGRVFEFPAFEVEMVAEGPHGDFVRRHSDQVSQSQREYLDIIFRIALLETLGADGCSLVVDGPEGAVDAVFAERAGDLFSAYAKGRNRNVVLACNVVEGGLIPNTLRGYATKQERVKRLVNLLEAAQPTTALTELKDEYEKKVEAILRQPSQ